MLTNLTIFVLCVLLGLFLAYAVTYMVTAAYYNAKMRTLQKYLTAKGLPYAQTRSGQDD